MMLGSHLYSLKYMPSLNLAVSLSPNKNYGYVEEGLLMILPLPIWCLEERDEGKERWVEQPNENLPSHHQQCKVGVDNRSFQNSNI